MIRRLLPGVLALATLLTPLATGVDDGGDLVNAVLGKASFRTEFNTSPAGAGETLRIRTHLAAVAERLARTDVSALPPGLRHARARNIERLITYTRAARFPTKPAGIPGRVPNFLDENGAVCAVGYLIEQDLGRGAVEAIAREYQFDYIPYIDSPVVAEWQARSGLTPLELAMIQPEYGGPEPEPDAGFSDEDVLVLLLVTGDVVSSIVNITVVTEQDGNRAAGFLGILFGAFSIAYDTHRDDPTGWVTAAGAISALLGTVSLGLASVRL